MTFRFLNETRRIVEKPWGADVPSQLWRYNLHYFDDLNAFDAKARHRWHLEAIEHWILDNPPGSGDAWAPFPTSLRAVNWIKWALGGAVLEAPVAHSLAMQVRALSQRLEYHLLGNHLFANAKALVFAGLFFKGGEAERWLERGMTILARETPEQILADGGQFERSPMYHALALEDLLDLLNIIGARAAPGSPAHALAPKLRETAYALAVEVAAADLAVGKAELRFLAILRDRFGLDKLVTAALERSAIARYQMG